MCGISDLVSSNPRYEIYVFVIGGPDILRIYFENVWVEPLGMMQLSNFAVPGRDSAGMR